MLPAGISQCASSTLWAVIRNFYGCTSTPTNLGYLMLAKSGHVGHKLSYVGMVRSYASCSCWLLQVHTLPLYCMKCAQSRPGACHREQQSGSRYKCLDSLIGTQHFNQLVIDVMCLHTQIFCIERASFVILPHAGPMGCQMCVIQRHTKNPSGVFKSKLGDRASGWDVSLQRLHMRPTQLTALPYCATLQVMGYCAWPGLTWSLDLCARATWPDIIRSYLPGR